VLDLLVDGKVVAGGRSQVPAFPIMRAQHDWCGDFEPAASEGVKL
jgi:hypothetical protein